MSENEFRIIKGPDRMDLFNSMILRAPVTFEFAEELLMINGKLYAPKLVAIINSIEAESGDGHSWNISGYCSLNGLKFKAFYKTHPKHQNTGESLGVLTAVR